MPISYVPQINQKSDVCLWSPQLCTPSYDGWTAHLSVFLFCFVFFADSLQAQLINMDVIPTLVKLLGIHSHNTALTEMCLIAFGNLAELGEYKHH